MFALKPKDTPGTISVPETEFKEATEPANPIANAASEITLWTYPIGDWGNENTVTQLIAAFEKETGINYKDVFKAAQKGASDYSSRTGRPAFA